MDIKDAIGEGFYEKRREQAHVAGQADEIDLVFVEDGYDLAVESIALKTFRWEDASGEAAGSGAVDAGGAFTVADDDGNFGVGDAACGHTIGEGFEVGAATT